MIRDLLFCAGGGNWSPLSLFANGEKGFWFDASDLTTLFQDAAGTTAVTTSSQPVGLWADKSGNSNNVIQATASKRPLFVDTSGKYTVNFDGVDDILEKSSVSAGTTNSITMCLGVSVDTLHTMDLVSFLKQTLGLSGSNAIYEHSTKTVTSTNAISSGAKNVLLGYSDIISTPVTITLNGVTTTGVVGTTDIHDGILEISKQAFSTIQISQIIVVMRQLTATEKTQVTDYITGKQ